MKLWRDLHFHCWTRAVQAWTRRGEIMAAGKVKSIVWGKSSVFNCLVYSFGHTHCSHSFSPNDRLLKLTEVEPIYQSKSYFSSGIKIYEAQFSATGIRNPPTFLSELYCLRFEGWQDCKLGVISHDFPSTISFRNNSETRSVFKLWIVVCEDNSETKDSGWLSRQDFKKLQSQRYVFLSMISLGSTSNIVRQLEGEYFLFSSSSLYNSTTHHTYFLLRTSCCMHLSPIFSN